MKKEMVMMQTMQKYEKELERRYKSDIKSIKKQYKDKNDRDVMVKNLTDQYKASKLALTSLINEKKCIISVASQNA